PGAQAQGGVLSCSNPSVTLIGVGNGSFAWTGPNGFTSNQPMPVVGMAGTYTLVVTGDNGCTSEATAEVTMDSEVPGAQAQGGVLNCTNTTVMLMGSGNGTYAWTGPNGFTSNQQNPVVSVAGSYTLVVTGTNGCTSEAVAEVTMDNTLPGAQAQGGTITCGMESVMLMGSGNGTYAWTGPNGFTSTEQNPTVSVAGTYTLVVTGANGCTSQASAEVILDNAAPGAQAQGGVLSCANTSVMLMGVGNGTFAWTAPNGFTSNQQNPVVGMAGTYTLVVTGANGCTSEASAEVTMDGTVPGAQAQGGTISCGMESVMLMGSGNGTFAWTGPNGFTSTEQNPTVSTAGTYTLVVTGANGCASQASAEVILDNAAPGAQATGGTISCGMESLMLMGTGNGTYAWSGPNGFTSTQQNPTVSVAGTYTLVVTGANGCTSQASAEVILDNAAPGAQASGGTITCGMTSVMLMGTGNGTYAWTGPNGFTSTEQNPTVSAAGTYTLVVTGANGCTSEATAEVVRNSDVPTASAQGGLLTCANTSVMLNGGSTTQGATFAWSGPAGFTSGLEDPTVTEPGVYVLTVSGPNGCTAQASATVELNNDVPNVSAEGTTLTCVSWEGMLNGSSATQGVSFSWSGPNGFTSNEEDPMVTEGGTYLLTVTSINGCTASASAEVIVDRVQPQVSAQGGVLDCEGNAVVLSATYPQGTSPMWSGPNGFVSAAANPSVMEPGVYQVVVTAANGCSGIAEAVVTRAECGGCKDPLIIECAPNVKVECGMPLEPTFTGEPVIRKTEECPKAVYFTYHDQFSGVCPVILTRTWTIGDEAGNYENCVQIITIEDHSEPMIHNVPDAITVNCGDLLVKPNDVWADDNCKSYVPMTYDERTIPGNCPGNYTIERMWTAIDDCGNIA
ncbi:MAG TPA: hypothetical protein VHL57_02315, partial [Flavobacteriales bacterium]|nr:hypothetical protein [Flavobacteriales bacterium]